MRKGETAHGFERGGQYTEKERKQSVGFDFDRGQRKKKNKGCGENRKWKSKIRMWYFARWQVLAEISFSGFVTVDCIFHDRSLLSILCGFGFRGA